MLMALIMTTIKNKSLVITSTTITVRKSHVNIIVYRIHLSGNSAKPTGLYLLVERHEVGVRMSARQTPAQHSYIHTSTYICMYILGF